MQFSIGFLNSNRFVLDWDCSATKVSIFSSESPWISSECLFLLQGASLHQTEEGAFLFSGAQRCFWKKTSQNCEILRAIHFLGCVPFSLSPCLLMTSFQYCCSVLDSRMLTCLSALTHAVCIAPERHYCRELHLAEQNNFCYLFQGGVCLCCSWNWRRDVSGWNQYTK